VEGVTNFVDGLSFGDC